MTIGNNIISIHQQFVVVTEWLKLRPDEGYCYQALNTKPISAAPTQMTEEEECEEKCPEVSQIE